MGVNEGAAFIGWMVPVVFVVLAFGARRVGSIPTGLADLNPTAAHRHHFRGAVRAASGRFVPSRTFAGPRKEAELK